MHNAIDLIFLFDRLPSSFLHLFDRSESREEIAEQLKIQVDKLSKEWGINVTQVGLQDIGLPADMKRAFAVQAEAERGQSGFNSSRSIDLDRVSINPSHRSIGFAVPGRNSFLYSPIFIRSFNLDKLERKN